MLIPKSVFCISKVCQENSRFALSSIKVERGESNLVHAIATNGRRMVVVDWDDSGVTEYPPTSLDTSVVPDYTTLVPQKTWNEAGKMCVKNKFKPILNNVVLVESITDKVVLGTYDGDTVRTITATPTEGRFPNWKDVIPNYEVLSLSDEQSKHQFENKAICIKLDAKLLAETAGIVCEAAEQSDDMVGVLEITIPMSGNSVVILRAHGKQNVQAFLMPLV